MEGVTVGAVARVLTEYGILGLGWIFFLFSMLYIRAERTRYQELVIHIISYFTKVQMLKGPDDELASFADNLFKTKGSDRRSVRQDRRGIDSESNERE